MRRHVHPVMIAEYLWSFIYLLLIPVARSLVRALRFGISGWLQGTWFDLFIIVITFALAIARWYSVTYEALPEVLMVRYGILFRTCRALPRVNTDTLALTYPFYLKPFGAVRVRADTKAGRSKRADVEFSLSKKAATELLSQREAACCEPDWLTREYRPRGVYIMALSAILSNSLAGVVFFATFISQSGRLLGEEFEQRIFGTFESFTRMMAFGLPPAAAALAYLAVFGWLFTFLRNLIRHKNFVARRTAHSLEIRGGIFTNRSYSVLVSALNYVDIRQSVLTKMLGLYSVFISAVGYGKQQDDVSALIPATTSRDLMHHLSLLLPEFHLAKRQLRPNFGAILRFLLDALYPCLLLPLATWILSVVLPTWADFIRWVGFMACLPAYLFLLVRIFDFSSSGVGRHGGIYTLRYSRGFYLHTVIMPRERVAEIVLRQSIFQKMDNKCDILMYSISEKRCKHHIRNIDKTMAIKVLGIEALAE